MSFLNFVFQRYSESGKTSVWYVHSKNASGGIPIAQIRWHAPWRKYVCETGEAIFDESCLSEIVDFLREETRKHKEK